MTNQNAAKSMRVNRILTTVGAAAVFLGVLSLWNTATWIGLGLFIAGIVAIGAGVYRSRA